MLERLQLLQSQQLISDLDLHFARLLGRLAKEPSWELLLAACLVSRWTGNGHVCIDLQHLAGHTVLESEDLIAPELDIWLKALTASPMVGQAGDYLPLILDAKGRLYLYRYWDYERRLAQDLSARAQSAPEFSPSRLVQGLKRLFANNGDSVDWQKVAAATAVIQGLCVISGGPGTGKTTTVTRILALLLEQSERPPRIGLAAPTGKAATRMEEAIRQAKQTLDVSEALLQLIPEEASTLHRLLGARPDSGYFRHDKNNPLALDVLVVDEASMVDLALMAKLVEALPPQARLILLGDKDQLASVEAGAVLGDICGGAPGFSAAFRTRLDALSGERIPPSGVSTSPLADCVVVLKHSYRFGSDSGIGRLARTVNRGQGRLARELLQRGTYPDIAWQSVDNAGEFSQRAAADLAQGFAPYLELVQARATAQEVLEAFNRFRVLCAYRRGPSGIETLNRLIESILQSQRLLNPRQTWYAGRPVMITRNDYNLRLFNGEVGITLPNPEEGYGRLRVFFQDADGSLRSFPPARLPEHQTVYAMTVHKSQGSEFDRVLMVLPFVASANLTRELLYTGITRARQAVSIWGNEQVLETAAGRGLWRSSGLRDALWESDDD